VGRRIGRARRSGEKSEEMVKVQKPRRRGGAVKRPKEKNSLGREKDYEEGKMSAGLGGGGPRLVKGLGTEGI